jgi:adenosylcobinamide-GDP ribazoletransferase
MKTFLTAIMFFTRIPCPSWVGHSENDLRASRQYLPIIGWIVGLFSAVAFICASLVFPENISVLISMAASILLTGAFHEDGFADVCDGFGGGYGRDQILSIMKDSRIGAYGAIGLIIILGLKYSFLVEIAYHGDVVFATSLISSHSLSRLASLIPLKTLQYVRDEKQSKSGAMTSATLRGSEMLVGAATGLAPVVLYLNPRVIVVVAMVCATEACMGLYFKKSIGGYTGDCLGAIQQVCELVTYAGLLLLWRFT